MQTWVKLNGSMVKMAVMLTSFMHVRRWEPEEDINAFRVAFNKDMNIFMSQASGQTGTFTMNLSGLAHL